MPKVGMEPVRRKALVDAALRVIGDHGSLTVTMSEIARQAGVSPALAHHYFGSKEQLLISAQNSDEGEARETVESDYSGDDTDIGFNAQYLQEFLNVVGSEKVTFEFKDGNSQAQLRPVSDNGADYKYVVMPMRL